MALLFPTAEWPEPSADAQRYLLLDGAQCERPVEFQGRLPNVASSVRLFDGVLADGSADTSVYLIRLRSDASMAPLLRRLSTSAKYFGAATFLDSALPQDELVQRLKRRLDARLPNGKEFLARFYDGRVLPLLVAVLIEQQRDSFLAMGHAWWYVASNHVWQSLPMTDPDTDTYQPPLQLDDLQRRTIMDDSYPYTLIDHFRLTDQELLDRVPAPDQYRFIRSTMRVAETYGIRDAKRIVMICTWALLSGEHFHQESAWQKRLEDFASGKRTARQIGDEVWPMVEEWSEP